MILAKFATFANDANGPVFQVAASSVTSDLIAVVVGDPSNIGLALAIRQDVTRVTIGNVASGDACKWTMTGTPFPHASTPPANVGFQYKTISSAATKFVNVRSVIITPPKAYEVTPLYGKSVPFASARCQTDWQPLNSDFDTYRFGVINEDPIIPSAMNNLASIDVYAPFHDDSRIHSLAGAETHNEDYRIAVPHDAVFVSWMPAAKRVYRDIILIIIGALAAFAAALLIESVRPYVEMAVEVRDAESAQNNTHE